MKTQTVALLIFLVSSLSLSAQKSMWTIGVSSGLRGDLLLQTERQEIWTARVSDVFTMKRIKNRISVPPIEVNVLYNITDNFSVSSGLAFIQHKTQWESSQATFISIDKLMQDFSQNEYYIRHALQIPLTIRYDIPFKNTRFSFFAKLGLRMDISLYNGFSKENFPIEHNSVDINGDLHNILLGASYSHPPKGRSFNLLVNAGIGIAYKFKSGLGLSLSGEYNVGTMRTESFTYYMQIKDLGTDILKYNYEYAVYNKNECWSVLLGVSYAFKNKKKE